MASDDGYWALDAILNSAIALEAFPNDIVRLLKSPYDMGIKLGNELPLVQRLPESLMNVYRILPDLEELSSQTKYQVLYQLLCGRTFDPGTQPFQDFDFLIRLRHQIVHPKCEGIEHHVEAPYEKVTKKMIAGIRSRNLTHLESGHHIPWKRHLENTKAASWAVETARAMVVAIYDVFPDSITKTNMIAGMVGPNSSLNRPL